MAKATVDPESGSSGSRPPGDFYIAATSSLIESRPRTLKHGDTFALFDHYGDIPIDLHGPTGLFRDDTRHLSRLELSIENHRPLLLSSTQQEDNANLTVDLANPDLYGGDRMVLSRETVHLIRSKFLWRGTCYERLALRNFDQEAHRIRLGFKFGADFADLFEPRGIRRERRGETEFEQPGEGSVLFRYRGLDRLVRTTRIDFDPAPTRLGRAEAVLEVPLPSREQTVVLVTVRCNSEQRARRGEFLACFRQARRKLRSAASRAAAIDSSDTMLNRVLCRSVNDLYMLLTDTPQGPYPYAGIPWFSTAFGRDGIIAALEMAWLGDVPFGLYYGSVDATPLFVLLAARYFERTGDRATLEALWPCSRPVSASDATTRTARSGSSGRCCPMGSTRSVSATSGSAMPASTSSCAAMRATSPSTSSSAASRYASWW